MADCIASFDKNILMKGIDQKEVIFIHIPRTAGTSIKSSLLQNGNVKMLWNRHHHIPSREFIQQNKNAFSFCFVRNPWDRLASAWRANKYSFENNISTNGTYSNRKRMGELLEKGFSSFATYFVEGKFSWKPQIDFFTDNQGLLVNLIGKYETLEKDFDAVCKILDVKIKLGLKHSEGINRPPFSEDYRRLYTTKTKDMVGEFETKTIEQFGYEF